jgi:hypothetical protein
MHVKSFDTLHRGARNTQCAREYTQHTRANHFSALGTHIMSSALSTRKESQTKSAEQAQKSVSREIARTNRLPTTGARKCSGG